MQYVWLMTAILSEVFGTSMLNASQGFRRPWPIAGVVVGYGLAFYCMSQCMRMLPMGVIYAIWSGVGIVLIALSGRIFFGQKLDWAAMAGIGLILAGVVVIQLFSSTTHN